MPSKSDVEAKIKELAKALHAQNRKTALSVIRSRLNDSFNDEQHQNVWKGWERAIQRQENGSLIIDLFNGLPKKDALKHQKELKQKQKEVLIRDHAQTELSKSYLATWVDLLSEYCLLCK